jgi:hypothetical protein
MIEFHVILEQPLSIRNFLVATKDKWNDYALRAPRVKLVLWNPITRNRLDAELGGASFCRS